MEASSGGGSCRARASPDLQPSLHPAPGEWPRWGDGDFGGHCLEWSHLDWVSAFLQGGDFSWMSSCFAVQFRKLSGFGGTMRWARGAASRQV